MPYVPEKTEMREFTFRAVLIGLVMTVVLGAANAYLGLRAGMTIAATYPAAVIGMALLRLRKGSLLEENIARTVGSIGESVAAGAIFTLPQRVFADQFAHFGLRPVPGFATTVICILFLGGVQLLCVGILGEYVGRIYENLKGRPVSTVAKILGVDWASDERGSGRRDRS